MKEREQQEKKEEQEEHEEQVERDEHEETTKGKAAPAGEAQKCWRKPGQPCEEELLQLEVWDNLQKERKAYSKWGLIFTANWEKACSQKS